MESNNKAVTETPYKTNIKISNQSDINETNFDIEMSQEKGLVQFDKIEDGDHVKISSQALRIGCDVGEEEMKCPQSQQIKSKKQLDTLATADIDNNNFDSQTQEYLATIPENVEIIENREIADVAEITKENSLAQDYEEEKVREKDDDLKKEGSVELSDNFIIEPKPVHEHKQRPQSMRPFIGNRNQIAINNVSLDEVPDIDHCDNSKDSMAAKSKKNNSDKGHSEQEEKSAIKLNQSIESQADGYRDLSDRRNIRLSLPGLNSPDMTTAAVRVENGSRIRAIDNFHERDPSPAARSRVAFDEEVREADNTQLRAQEQVERDSQDLRYLANKAKADAWNNARQKILRNFQTIFGISLILTIIFVQWLILVSEFVNHARMIAQAVLVFIDCILLYLIIIGISNLPYQSNKCSKLVLLTYFNDNSRQIEQSIQNNIESQGNTQETIHLIHELQSIIMRKQKKLRKIYGFAIILFVIIVMFQYMDRKILNENKLDLNNKEERTAAILNYLITSILGVLAIPYIFQLLCQFIVKLFLWPIDLANFNMKWTYNIAYPQANRLFEPNYNRNENRPSDLSIDVKNIDNIGLNPFGVSNISALEIRINQVAAWAILEHQIDNPNIDMENQEHEVSPALRQQRLISLGKDIWMELKQNTIEYNMDIGNNCNNCSICLVDFNLRQKEENIPGDSVIQLRCSKAHVFHSDCLKDWVDLQYTCPICREVLVLNQSESKMTKYKSIVKRNIIITMQNEEFNEIRNYEEQVN